MEPEKREQPTNQPPPNPHYTRVYTCSLSHGWAHLEISAPGNKIAPQDAQDVIDWLELTIRQLRRYADLPEHNQP